MEYEGAGGSHADLTEYASASAVPRDSKRRSLSETATPRGSPRGSRSAAAAPRRGGGGRRIGVGGLRRGAARRGAARWTRAMNRTPLRVLALLAILFFVGVAARLVAGAGAAPRDRSVDVSSGRTIAGAARGERGARGGDGGAPSRAAAAAHSTLEELQALRLRETRLADELRRARSTDAQLLRRAVVEERRTVAAAVRDLFQVEGEGPAKRDLSAIVARASQIGRATRRSRERPHAAPRPAHASLAAQILATEEQVEEGDDMELDDSPSMFAN